MSDNIKGTSCPKLRLAIQNAKSVSMPKDRVDAAIKRASSKEEGNFEEVVYEGIGAAGVALMVECATDNTTRTVSNVRVIFSRGGGTLGTFGSVTYLFDRKGIFTIDASKINLDEAELDLIDAGAEDIYSEDGIVYVETSFNDFSGIVTIYVMLQVDYCISFPDPSKAWRTLHCTPFHSA